MKASSLHQSLNVACVMHIVHCAVPWKKVNISEKVCMFKMWLHRKFYKSHTIFVNAFYIDSIIVIVSMHRNNRNCFFSRKISFLIYVHVWVWVGKNQSFKSLRWCMCFCGEKTILGSPTVQLDFIVKRAHFTAEIEHICVVKKVVHGNWRKTKREVNMEIT